MPAMQRDNHIRQAMVIWGIFTLLYFFLTWVLIEYVVRTSQERLLAALATTVTYSAIAVWLGFRVVRETQRTSQQLQEMFAEIERAQTKTLATLDAATDGMLLISPDQRILSVNKGFCSLLFGNTSIEIAGHPLEDYCTEIEQTLAEPAWFRAMVRDTAADAEHQFAQTVIQKAPERREFQLLSTPVRTRSGEHLGRLYVFHDVTHEREVDRARTDFVSTVSHELRIPLTSIKGYVDLMIAGEAGNVTPEQREFLDIIKTNADRLVQLINALLDISRIDAGRFELKREAIDINLLIRQVANTFRPQIKAQQQQLTLDIAEGIPPVWGDPDRVIQILTNLISNAHKYTPKGGSIMIAARSLSGRVRVDVQDTGIGLSTEDQAKLFTKFFRVKSHMAQEVGGTGLGLAITRSLVELHGGEISVKSAPGQGSTFSFSLPLAQTALVEQ